MNYEERVPLGEVVVGGGGGGGGESLRFFRMVFFVRARAGAKLLVFFGWVSRCIGVIHDESGFW